jgi:hypothetical protein
VFTHSLKCVEAIGARFNSGDDKFTLMEIWEKQFFNKLQNSDKFNQTQLFVMKFRFIWACTGDVAVH